MDTRVFNVDLAEKARLHVDWVKKNCASEIDDFVWNTLRLEGPMYETQEPQTCSVSFENRDSVDAIFRTGYPNKVCVLNFASYKHPGGGFMQGAMAQEEALCHASTLYPVLKAFESSHYAENGKCLNRGLYTNTALYSPNIMFFREGQPDTLADVLTCAAPNYSVALRYGKFTAEENASTLSQRIEFIYRIVASRHVDTFIVGAWGCGVFKQDAEVVAELFLKVLAKCTPCAKLVFAVPGNNYNSRVFRRIIERHV